MSALIRSRAGSRADRFGDNDEGFTLIELLVVIIVIGILAAIAIPVFLAQRSKAYNGAALADIRDLAGFEELYLTDQQRYGTIAEIQASEPTLKISPHVTLSVVRYNSDQGYCLSATPAATGKTYYYDSLAGGIQPNGSTGCPKTTTGTPGDTVVG